MSYGHQRKEGKQMYGDEPAFTESEVVSETKTNETLFKIVCACWTGKKMLVGFFCVLLCKGGLQITSSAKKIKEITS